MRVSGVYPDLSGAGAYTPWTGIETVITLLRPSPGAPCVDVRSVAPFRSASLLHSLAPPLVMQIPQEVREERRDELMSIQQRNSIAFAESLVGKEVRSDRCLRWEGTWAKTTCCDRGALDLPSEAGYGYRI